MAFSLSKFARTYCQTVSRVSAFELNKGGWFLWNNYPTALTPNFGRVQGRSKLIEKIASAMARGRIKYLPDDFGLQSGAILKLRIGSLNALQQHAF